MDNVKMIYTTRRIESARVKLQLNRTQKWVFVNKLRHSKKDSSEYTKGFTLQLQKNGGGGHEIQTYKGLNRTVTSTREEKGTIRLTCA